MRDIAQGGWVLAVAFSPDGTDVLAGSGDGAIRVLNLAGGGAAAGSVMQSPSQVLALAFAPDGKSIAVGALDKTARLWNLAAGAPIGSFVHNGRVNTVAFSPDGKTVLTGSSDKTAQLWDSATRKPLGAPISHTSSVVAVDFAADGKRFLTACGDGTIQIWDTPVPLSGDAKQVTRRLRAATGIELDKSGLPSVLRAGAWKRAHDQPSVVGGAVN
jgi:WD40 repeat protein